MSPRREGWLHALVTAALALVLVRSLYGWTWLPLVFPALGVLFAGLGAASAATHDRTGRLLPYLRRAGLRVLAPLWLFGAVLVPVMSARGWAADEDLGSATATWDTAWLWVLPLADPPVSTEALGWTTGLWVLRTAFWLVLLTPALLWLFRRWPVRTATVPVVAFLLLDAGLTSITGETCELLIALCVHGCAWLVGFAYADGTLQRQPLVGTVVTGALLGAAGVALAVALPTAADTDLYDLPAAAVLHGVGGALLLLRLEPLLGRLVGAPRVRAVLGFLPRRALTAVLWADLVVVLAPVVLGWTPLARFDTPDGQGVAVEATTAALLLLAAAAVLGWAEAVALDGIRRRRRFVVEGNVVAAEVAVPAMAGQREERA